LEETEWLTMQRIVLFSIYQGLRLGFGEFLGLIPICFGLLSVFEASIRSLDHRSDIPHGIPFRRTPGTIALVKPLVSVHLGTHHLPDLTLIGIVPTPCVWDTS
jgi:hypothetical protein|tara:strand:+ start:240 stop:548 length:309 start_codon:yes stop_codon:yes gene_type:complete